MSELDDFVVYGATGVCRIVDIIREKFGRSPERSYFVLSPVYDPSATIYIPTENQAQMRRILNREEILALIGDMPDLESEWIADDKLRRSTFAEIIKANEPRRLIWLVKILHARQTEMSRRDKHLTTWDAEAMKAAEKLLHNEFALVLEIKPEQVVPFILGRLGI